MTTKELMEKRLELHKASQALLETAEKEKRALTAEEQAKFDAFTQEMTDIKATADRRAIAEAEEKALGESRGRKTDTVVKEPSGAEITEEDRDLAFRAWALGRKCRDQRMLDAARKVGIDVSAGELHMGTKLVRGADGKRTVVIHRVAHTEAEYRALGSGAAPAAGATIPNEAMRAFEEYLKWFGGVREVATPVRTETGATLPWPTVDDTGNTGEIIAESGPVTTTADPTFGLINLGAYKFSSKAVIVPVELLQDSFVDLASFLGQALGTRIGRIQNNKFTIGTGTGEPKGIAEASSLGKTAAATNAITFDEVIDLIHSVDRAYRPRASFMLHDQTVQAVRKLKDSQNRYLWEMSLQAGIPDRLFGYPAIINSDMPTMTTGAKVVLYGELSNYLVREAGPTVFIRADELRVLNHQSVFVAFQRADGNLPVTSSIKHLKNA